MLIPFFAAVLPASAMPEIYVYPPVVTAEQGETFDVDVRISGAIDVFSWEFTIYWNASVLEYVTVEEGDFLAKQPEGTFFVNSTTDIKPEGTEAMVFACTTLGVHPGISGRNTLATITFLVEVKGETVLDLGDEEDPDEEPTKLRDSSQVPQPILHTSTDGLFTNVAGLPVASFTFYPEISRIGDTVFFNATDSHDPDGYIVWYFWDFGDGETANVTTKTVTHAYSAAGDYEVTLSVQDNAGLTGIATESVRVRHDHDVEVTSVSPSSDSVEAGQSVTIDVTVMNDGALPESSIEVTAYYDNTEVASPQTINDLDPGDSKSVEFVWNTEDVEPGDYRVKAVATPVSGETDTADNTEIDGTVTVTEASSNPLYGYIPIIGAALIVVAVIVAVGFLLIRRKP